MWETLPLATALIIRFQLPNTIMVHRVTNQSNYCVRANVDQQPRNGRRTDAAQPKSGTTRPREVQPRSIIARRGGSPQ